MGSVVDSGLPTRCVDPEGESLSLANIQMEPTRPAACVIMRRGARLI